jgi:hypothetical protein
MHCSEAGHSQSLSFAIAGTPRSPPQAPAKAAAASSGPARFHRLAASLAPAATVNLPARRPPAAAAATTSTTTAAPPPVVPRVQQPQRPQQRQQQSPLPPLPPTDHPVVDLLRRRVLEGSTPGRRSDGFKLGLAVEGGGMRGIVTGAMLMALLGFDARGAFDAVYGASAGAINATYFLTGARVVVVGGEGVRLGFWLGSASGG